MIVNAQITLGEGSTTFENIPIDTRYGNNYSQQIFTKQEINADAAGNITGIKFYAKPSVNLSLSSGWTVYLGHTSKTDFYSKKDWIPATQLTNVFSGTVSNINGVVEIIFSTPFAYDNVRNLVVAVYENTVDHDVNTSYAFSAYQYNNYNDRTIYFRDENINPNPLNPPVGMVRRFKSVITMMGLNPNPVPSCAIVTYPVNNDNLVPLSPVIKWYGEFGATGYRVSIGTSSGGTDVVNQQTVSTTSFSPQAPLSPNTTYYLKVASVGPGGVSSGCTEIKFKTRPSAPSNDECANAITLSVNPDMSCGIKKEASTVSATNSGLSVSPECGGTADDDIWYKFTATATRHVIAVRDVVTLIDAGSYGNLSFQVFQGSCNNLEMISCYPAVGYYSGDDSSVLNNLTIGNTYYIRFFSNGFGDALGFNICIGTPPPPATNDNCIDAVGLTVNPGLSCGIKTSGNNLNATNSNIPISPCSGTPDNDVWFKFTATSNKHIISLFNSYSIVNSGNFSTPIMFQVLSGNCNTLTNVGCLESNKTKKVFSNLTIGETYYVRVYTNGGQGGARSFDICVGTISSTPANDACSGALVASTFPYTYTQSDATGATNNDGFITACTYGMNDGTWFTFTGDGNDYKIKVSMPAGSTFDPKIGLYSGECNNLFCENYGADDYGPGEAESMSVSTTIGKVYYVNVGYFSATDDELEDVFTIAIIKESLGTSEISKDKSNLNAYPNPFTQVINILNADKVKSVSVLDASGRLVKTIENPSSVLELENLKQGVYIMILNMKDGSKQTTKIIKK